MVISQLVVGKPKGTVGAILRGNWRWNQISPRKSRFPSSTPL
ncbi:hypothetical protein HNQ36_003834 [Afipia massiliensis]|uniref:Uncharacterized protein n=1 Tax=Afipia massiliensis TaxID=211460 RepID=A0A840N5E6_9BRAD|nr:hypothetical protein [Afipia massiliensis]